VRQNCTQTTDAEDARMTEEELVAGMSRHVIPNIYKDSDASALRRAKVSTRSSVVGLTETTPAADDAPLQR
jgi:hypothetical protein